MIDYKILDSREAFCTKCRAAIRQYDTDGGLWLTDCLGGGYDCGAGGLHDAPALIGMFISNPGNGAWWGTVESFTPTSVTVSTDGALIVADQYSELHARVSTHADTMAGNLA